MLRRSSEHGNISHPPPSAPTMDETERRYLHAVLTARVYELAQETALQPMPRLSRRLQTEVRLKREDTQPVFSFKLRGAANKLAQLPAEAVSLPCRPAITPRAWPWPHGHWACRR